VGLIQRQFGTIAEEKAAAKEQRRKRWHEKQERLSGLQTRRDGRPRDVKRKEFREWHDKRRIYQEIMDKKARQEGLDWKIKVAAVVERLPIVLPDKEPWEKDYLELRRYLDQFDFEYPSELGMDDLVDDFDYDGGKFCRKLCMFFISTGIILNLATTSNGRGDGSSSARRC
jgi:hypothetical protein